MGEPLCRKILQPISKGKERALSYVFCKLNMFSVQAYNFPWSKGEPCNCDTFTPISLFSSEAKPVHLSKMEINISNDAEFQFINSGISSCT